MQVEQKDSSTASDSLIDPRQWVSRHADYLYTYALTRLNDEELARDLVQETFLAALEKVDQFKGNSTERTWLTAILKYKVIDLYRKRSAQIAGKTGGTSYEKEEEFFDPNDGHWNTPYRPKTFGIEDQDPFTNKEFTRILQLCMQKLPTLWLSVFTMKHLDDEATETICAELKVSPSNFWVIIHRTKVNLRACLQKHWI